MWPWQLQKHYFDLNHMNAFFVLKIVSHKIFLLMFWILITLVVDHLLQAACVNNSKPFIFSDDFYLEARFVRETKYEHLIGILLIKQNFMKCTGFVVTESRAVTAGGCFEFIQTDSELLVNVKSLRVVPGNRTIKSVFLDTERRLVTDFSYLIGLSIIEVDTPFKTGLSFVNLLEKDANSFKASLEKFKDKKACEVVGYEFIVEEHVSKSTLVPVVFVESKKCKEGMICGRVSYGKKGKISANEFGMSGAPLVCNGRPFGIYAERINGEDLVLFYSLQGENQLSEGAIKAKMRQGNIFIHSHSNVQKPNIRLLILFYFWTK